MVIMYLDLWYLVYYQFTFYAMQPGLGEETLRQKIELMESWSQHVDLSILSFRTAVAPELDV